MAVGTHGTQSPKVNCWVWKNSARPSQGIRKYTANDTLRSAQADAL